MDITLPCTNQALGGGQGRDWAWGNDSQDPEPSGIAPDLKMAVCWEAHMVCTQSHPWQIRSSPSFPHIQSIEHAEHADQPQACCKTQEKQPNPAEKKEMRNVQTVSARKSGKNGKGGFVRGGFGWRGRQRPLSKRPLAFLGPGRGGGFVSGGFELEWSLAAGFGPSVDMSQQDPQKAKAHRCPTYQLQLPPKMRIWGSQQPSSGKRLQILRIIVSPQPPSLLILLPEPGSERKVLTKETWFSLVREWKSWKLQQEQFLPRAGSP